MVKSIELLFGHMTVRSANSPAANVLNACLQLVHDPDYKVRKAFRWVEMKIGMDERLFGILNRGLILVLLRKANQS